MQFLNKDLLDLLLARQGFLIVALHIIFCFCYSDRKDHKHYQTLTLNQETDATNEAGFGVATERHKFLRGHTIHYDVIADHSQR